PAGDAARANPASGQPRRAAPAVQRAGGPHGHRRPPRPRPAGEAAGRAGAGRRRVEERAALPGRPRRRLSIRPGITCLWQVSGRSDLTFAEWMALDLEDGHHWTLWVAPGVLLRCVHAAVTA